MRTNNHAAIAITFLLILSGCTAERLTGGAYEAVYQKHCMDTVRGPDCDPEHRSYDNYNREREEALKKWAQQ